MSASHLRIPAGSLPDLSDAPPYDVVVRFSASIPDLDLSVPTFPDPTTATLKQLIRASLPSKLRDRRIRLIYAGKALEDDALLSSAIRRLPSYPGRSASPRLSNGGSSPATSDKGKQPVRDSVATVRTYIHCSIGEVVLSANELAAERALADQTTKANGGQEHGKIVNLPSGEPGSTTPAPRGFDRLLSAGFSVSEVQNLRLQFMAIQAHTHTPDTMPSPNTLRNLEDRWLDNSNSTELGSAGGNTAGWVDDDAAAGALDDMLWGAALGFFWPVGCLFWGFREDGIWSQRRRMAIVVGMVLNVGIGLIRYTS